MKREMLDFLQQSFRSFAIVFTAFYVAASFTANAQDKASGNNQDSSPNTERLAEVQADISLGESENLERNEVFDKQILPKMDEAEKLYAAKKFEEAYQFYAEIKELAKPQNMGYSPYVLSMNRKIDMLKNNAQIAYANNVLTEARRVFLDATAQKDNAQSMSSYEKAKDLATDARAIYYMGNPAAKRQNIDGLNLAIERNPSFSKTVEDFLSRCDKMINAIEFDGKVSLKTIDPDYKARMDKINLLLRTSETLYRNQEYARVRDNMELVLVMDPYNEKAVELLSKTYKKLYNIAQLRNQNELLAQIAETEWKWNEAVLPTDKIVPKDPPKERNLSKSGLYEKLQNLMVDNIEFDRAKIQNVIAYVKAKSKEIDPDGIGVNIVQSISPTDIERIDLNGITISLDHVPLLEVIRYITQDADLKFRVDEKTVTIGSPQNINEKDRRSFKVRASLIQRITGGTFGTKTEDSGGDFKVSEGFGEMKVADTFKSGGAGAKAALGSTTKADSDALKAYFSARGVPFEEGTTIAYDPRANNLTVSNTPENLRKLEALIRDIDIQTPLVLIESKILEIKMNDLEELGFDWLLTHNNESNPNYTWSMQSPLRNSGMENNILVNKMNVLPNFGGDNIYSLYLTVNAIDRTDRTEILSTPKVIATTGTEAEIRMVREMYFPESWTEPETSVSNGSQFTFEPSYPEFGDSTDVGIVFSVTPTVSPNNYTITLQLHPQVIELTGWTDYSYDIVLGDFNTKLGGAKVTLKMQELSRRDIETNVKVYDGETVMLGGMVTDRHSQMDDQWPGLGDIPLVGRLFTNMSSATEKANLMISVTTRLMSGDGVPVRSNTANGLPDFHR